MVFGILVLDSELPSGLYWMSSTKFGKTSDRKSLVGDENGQPCGYPIARALVHLPAMMPATTAAAGGVRAAATAVAAASTARSVIAAATRRSGR